MRKQPLISKTHLDLLDFRPRAIYHTKPLLFNQLAILKRHILFSIRTQHDPVELWISPDRFQLLKPQQLAPRTLFWIALLKINHIKRNGARPLQNLFLLRNCICVLRLTLLLLLNTLLILLLLLFLLTFLFLPFLKPLLLIHFRSKNKFFLY